jgi:hypothetical protein
MSPLSNVFMRVARHATRLYSNSCWVHIANATDRPRGSPHSEPHFRRPNPNESLLVAVLPTLPGGVALAGGGGPCWSGSACALIATAELGLTPKELELLLSDAPPASPAAMASTLALAALTLSPWASSRSFLKFRRGSASVSRSFDRASIRAAPAGVLLTRLSASSFFMPATLWPLTASNVMPIIISFSCQRSVHHRNHHDSAADVVRQLKADGLPRLELVTCQATPGC